MTQKFSLGIETECGKFNLSWGSWPTRHWQRVIKESFSKENYFYKWKSMGAFPPPPPPSATEFVVFAFHLKRLIKSLTLGAEQGLVIFTLCCANWASNCARDSETWTSVLTALSGEERDIFNILSYSGPEHWLCQFKRKDNMRRLA